MTTQEKRQLWRIPLFASLLIALFWGVWYLIVGSIPVVDRIVFFTDPKNQFWGIPMEVPIPVLSRLWDVFFGGVWTMGIVWLRIVVKDNDNFYAGLVGDFTDASSWKKLRVTPHDHNPVNDAMGNLEAFERLLNGER